MFESGTSTGLAIGVPAELVAAGVGVTLVTGVVVEGVVEPPPPPPLSPFKAILGSESFSFVNALQ